MIVPSLIIPPIQKHRKERKEKNKIKGKIIRKTTNKLRREGMKEKNKLLYILTDRFMIRINVTNNLE